MMGILLIFLLFSGCSEYSIIDEKELDEVCHRLAKLDVTVVTPGSGVSDELAQKIRKLAREYGISVPEEALIKKNTIDGTSGVDFERWNRFKEEIDSSHEIIWARRGGFGSARLITSLDRLEKPSKSKTIIGFSDVTAINLFVSQNWPHWRVIHGSVFFNLVKEFSRNKFDTLLDILENRIDSYEIDEIYPLNHKAKTSRAIRGKLTGGNLSIIESGLKTCWEIQTKGKILFVEDISEAPERVYRSLYHLKEAGKLSDIAALLFGSFHQSDEKEMTSCLREFSETLDVPVYITNQFGHGNHNMPLIYNAIAKIQNNRMTVIIK
jgi:muramoyltetrapeptide carboxypeptidase